MKRNIRYIWLYIQLLLILVFTISDLFILTNSLRSIFSTLYAVRTVQEQENRLGNDQSVWILVQMVIGLGSFLILIVTIRLLERKISLLKGMQELMTPETSISKNK